VTVTPPPANPGPPHRAGLIARLRRYFLTGIVVAAPVLLTAYIAWATITWIDGLVTPLIPRQYLPETYLPFKIPGIGLVVVLIAFTLVGWITAGLAGRTLVRLGEGIVARMPVIRGVYSALKQVFETLFTQSSNSFRQVVLIEFPRRGSWSLGFVTGVTAGEVGRRLSDGRELINVFIPTTPNPTSGFLMFVPREELHFLDMSVEDGLKMLVSVGLVTPMDPARLPAPPE
jgi:uncharacterized membrane protein